MIGRLISFHYIILIVGNVNSIPFHVISKIMIEDNNLKYIHIIYLYPFNILIFQSMVKLYFSHQKTLMICSTGSQHKVAGYVWEMVLFFSSPFLFLDVDADLCSSFLLK